MVEAVEAVLRPPGVDVLLGGRGVPPALRDRPRVPHAPNVRAALRLIEELVG